MISEAELRALPVEQQVEIFTAQALAAEPGRLVTRATFVATARPRPVPRAGHTPPAAPAAARPASYRAGGKVRLGIVSVSSGLGGAERWVSNVLEAIDAVRIEVAGIALMHDVPDGWPSLKTGWERVAPVGVGDGTIAALAARVDVLLTWGVVDFAWGISPARLASLVPADLPVIHTSHGSIEYGTEESASRAIPAAVSRAALRGLAPSKRASAKVIFNMVHPDRVAATVGRDEVRSGWGIPAGRKVAGYLGRISPEKRVGAFVDGVGLLPGRWHGAMVGPDVGGHSPPAELLGRVATPGPTDRIGDALGAFDAFVMCSSTEACSIALAEAWLAGVPAISPPVGMLEDFPGLARILPAEPTGADVAAAILADEADPAGTAARVARARDFATREMGPEKFGREWTDFLCGVARPPARGNSIDPAVRDRILACPARGGVLPISMQASCGCSGKELTECRAGRGTIPGRVTLADCRACKATA